MLMHLSSRLAARFTPGKSRKINSTSSKKGNSMSRKNSKREAWIDALGDGRRATEAMMQVNSSLEEAATACRALVHDAARAKDPAFTKSMRKLLSLVNRMKAGPNVGVWQHLHPIETTAGAAVEAIDAAAEGQDSSETR
jgi:hypothetical protein